MVTIYILTNLSNLVFYLREQRSEFNWLLNGVVPVVGSLIFLPALVASFGIDFAGLGITGLGPPANLAPLLIGIWMVVGVGLLIYFSRRAPERIAETGRVFVEEPEAGASPAPRPMSSR